MRAAGRATPGGAVTTFDVPDPGPPRADEIVVRSALTTVNPADSWLMSGGLVAHTDAQKPVWAGIETLGTVMAVGPLVDDLTVGDVVVAGTSFLPDGRGTHAEYAVIPHRYRTRIAGSHDDTAFAGLPVAAGAALLAIDLAGVGSGDLLVVTGAAGAVGRAAVQFARRRGVRVAGVARTADHDLVTSLGAETVEPDVGSLAATAAAVIDAASLGLAVAACLRPGGTLVALRPPGRTDADVRVVTASVGALISDAGILPRVVAAVHDGWLQPACLERFAVDDVAAAYAFVAATGRRGTRPVLMW